MRKISSIFLILIFLLFIEKIYSNEKKADMNIKESKIEKSFISQFTDLNQKDSLIKLQKKDYNKIANGYLAMGIIGTIILPGLAIPAGYLLFKYFVLANFFYDQSAILILFDFVFVILKAIGAIIGIAAAAAPGILFIIFGFYYYKKYKKQKMLNPFIQSDPINKSMKIGFKFNLG